MRTMPAIAGAGVGVAAGVGLAAGDPEAAGDGDDFDPAGGDGLAAGPDCGCVLGRELLPGPPPQPANSAVNASAAAATCKRVTRVCIVGILDR
jgi:hypothetical protein